MRRRLASFRRAGLRRRYRDATRLGFGEYARAWIAGYQGRTAAGVRPETRDWYRQMLDDRLIPYFDVETGLLLSEIEPRDVKSLVAWLAEQPNPRAPARTLAPSTVGYHVAVLRALFADAVEEGVVRSNPTSGVRATVRRAEELGETPSKALTRSQLRRLLDEIPDDRRLFFEFLAHTGLLSPGLAARLRALEGPPGTLAFTTPTGKQLNRSNLWRDVLRPAAVRADVPWVGFHTFRHTCASLLFAAGKNVKQVQVWLGHADPGFTVRTYIHLMDDGLGDASFLDGL